MNSHDLAENSRKFVQFVSGTETASISLAKTKSLVTDSDMNTQPVELNAPVIETTHAEPGKLLRIGMFIFFALPGAWLVGTCGPLIVTVTANQPDAAFFCLLISLLALGAAMLLHGTRSKKEPLFLLVFVPMPILISLGYHLGYLGNDAGFFIAVLGMIWPMITYRPISRYYKRHCRRRRKETMTGFGDAADEKNIESPDVVSYNA
jgi:hypothetical protein